MRDLTYDEAAKRTISVAPVFQELLCHHREAVERIESSQSPSGTYKDIELQIRRFHEGASKAFKAAGLECPAFTRYLPYNLNDEDSINSVWNYYKLGSILESVDRKSSYELNPRHVDYYEEGMPILRINAPAWYDHEGFLEFLNGQQVATWHKRGEEPGEYSDVMFTFDSGEGSNYGYSTPEQPSIPSDIWQLVHNLAVIKFGEACDCLVWVSNMGPSAYREKQNQLTHGVES